MRKRTKFTRSRIIRKWDGTAISDEAPANKNLPNADNEVEAQFATSGADGLESELKKAMRPIDSRG